MTTAVTTKIRNVILTTENYAKITIYFNFFCPMV